MNIEAIKQNIARALEIRENVSFSFFIGSVTTNRMHLESDIDIAVYFDNEPELLEIGELVAELEAISDSKIDLIVMNKLPSEHPEFAMRILTDGAMMFCEENDKLANYKYNALRYYLDFKPYIDLFHNKFLERNLVHSD